MDEQAFIAKYSHDITKRVTVVNPTTKDFIFQHVLQVGVDLTTGKMKDEQKTYRVPAGGKERFPGPVADHYLDQMAKILAQNDNKIQHMIDFALRAQYYDDLIVDVEDLISSYHSFDETPEYLKDKPPVEEEKPFAEVVQAEPTTEHVFVGKDKDKK